MHDNKELFETIIRSLRDINEQKVLGLLNTQITEFNPYNPIHHDRVLSSNH